MKVKRFAIMGVGGYVAPRHLRAIYDLGHILVAALDISDSVGILDRYFPHCQFFTMFERFERFLEKERLENRQIDFLTVCTPNYLHDAHCRFGLRIGANVICEKPLVLNPWNVDALVIAEKEYAKKIANILQLRLHPEIILLKERVDSVNAIHNVYLEYITPRGPWYDVSWKGDQSMSGGIITNIGVHLFDLLLWIFGEVIQIEQVTISNKNASGLLLLRKAKVRWSLSTDFKALKENQMSSRSLTCDNEVIHLDHGFEELHTDCYAQILKGEIIGPVDLKPLIQLMWELRQKTSSN